MTRKLIRLLPCLLLALPTISLHAQARAAVYGTIGRENSGVVHEPWTLGGTIGAYADYSNTGPIALAADLRADLSSNIKSILIGPRVAFHAPAFPIKPYAEFLVGRASFNNSHLGFGIKLPSQFTARYVFGADVTILPHIDWRAIDYSAALNASAGNGGYAKTVSTGLVVRF